MKNLIIALIVLFTVPSFAQNNDLPGVDPVIYQAALDEFYADHEFLKDVDSGHVTVDLTAGQISLFLQPAFHCPDGLVCIQVMPEPIIIDLPIVETVVNECNWTVYTAKVDKTPVDGLLEIITVSDYSKNTCPTIMALPETAVNYASFNPWVNQWTYSNFHGAALILLSVFN